MARIDVETARIDIRKNTAPAKGCYSSDGAVFFLSSCLFLLTNFFSIYFLQGNYSEPPIMEQPDTLCWHISS